MTSLFTPLQLGDLTLPNRIVMAPLTRARAGERRIPNAIMAEYYRQRASAGLIISEAVSVTPMGVGYAETPGIWNDEQIAGWKLVTGAVHEAGGRIFMQLWHVGRVSHPELLDGQAPVSPSAIKPAGRVRQMRPERPYVTPRALTTEEIAGVIEDYRKGAAAAKAAGFDGVELHAANGYLVDQFLQDSTNSRTDQYGGSLENRTRFLEDVTDALVSVWGGDRVGIHLAPRADEHDMGDSDLKALFSRVAQQMKQRGVGFLMLREYLAEDSLLDIIKAEFGGIVIANEGLTPQTAAQLVESGRADAVGFGKDFIATPDLPHRVRHGLALNEQDLTTFYGKTGKGYTDYPTADAIAAA